MKFLRNIAIVLITLQLVNSLESNLICFYDAQGSERDGVAKFTTTDMEISLQFCTHLIYGYAGINPDTYQVSSINPQRDVQRRHFATITALKEKFPNVKFLLSVGGDRDGEGADKYIQLLEAGRQKQSAFIESARDLLRSYNFDGLDLAFQLPRNKPRKVHSDIGMAWKSFKKLFTGDFIVDPNSDEHKEQFTDLVNDLKAVLRPHNLMLSLTVLPNVNSSWYFNAPAIINNLDFINLAAFDFTTPQRNPEEADYTAPLFSPVAEGNRLSHYNIDFQVDHWISQRVPHTKINVGVASYGRSWKMIKDSNADGFPIVTGTDGPGPAGPQTKMPGLLNWAEVCLKLPNPSNVDKSEELAPLRRVSDPTRKYGTYAYRAPNSEGEHGEWVSYEDPDTASTKAIYAKNRGLGGIALFDLTLDDFHGQCTGDKFPMLRAIKYRLL